MHPRCDQGAWWYRQVEIVVFDGSRSYQAAIAQYLPDARHVLDRFHVARWFTQGLALVRRELQRRPPDQRPPTYEPDLFRNLFHPAMAGGSSHRLPPGASGSAVRSVSPAANRPGRPLQELYQLYEAEDLDGANQALGRFADLYDSGQIPEYREIVDTIIAWGEEIPAYHSSRRVSNRPIEEINNLLQVLRRVAHGFTNYDNYPARGILVT